MQHQPRRRRASRRSRIDLRAAVVVSQNYVRAETIAAANELLLKVHARIPLVAALGDGHIATVDGMRFRVPVRSIHAGPNPRYFDTGRGVTWLNYMSDQFAGLHAIVVPGTLRDSLITLDGLLELQPPGAGGPTMIISDQASYSDQVSACTGCSAINSAHAPQDCPTSASGTSPATATTARCTASRATASTPR